jgi:hypothetical protein
VPNSKQQINRNKLRKILKTTSAGSRYSKEKQSGDKTHQTKQQIKTQIHIHGQKPYTKYPLPPSTAAS